MTPAGFLSYVRSDDDHDYGRITLIKERLEGELKIETGSTFPIFQDRNDIRWGQAWVSRIEESIEAASILIPCISPSFFKSEFCRREFTAFAFKERQIGVSQLIFPIYYILSPEIQNEEPSDEIAQVVKSRNYFDWRELRFVDHKQPDFNKAIAAMADAIMSSVIQITSQIAAYKKSKEAVAEESMSDHKSFIDQKRSDTPRSARRQSRGRGAKSSVPVEEVLYSYRVYTGEFDEIINAEKLADRNELAQLDAFINEKSEIDSSVFARLDVVREKIDNNWAVTLLIDHSGSMRGRKILYAAAGVKVIADLLFQAGVDFEVLGHTTKAWKGGQSREQWLAFGRPSNPGRLNDLRLITYKDFSEPWNSAAIRIGLMVKEGILKENIDGEAVDWAYSRLVRNPRSNRVLIVVSDGAPVDDSTLSVNSADYLDRHLKEVISRIEAEGKTGLLIGIEHKTSRFFSSSFVCHDATDVVSAFIGFMARQAQAA